MANLVENRSDISIDDNHKVEVILSVMNSARKHVIEWHNRAYTSTTWSISIMVGVGVFCIKQDDLVDFKWIFFVISILSFLVLGQNYLSNIKNALEGNGRVITKCEDALRLNEEKFYLKSGKIFEPSEFGEWVHPEDVDTLIRLHLLVGILVILSVIIFNFNIALA